MTNALNQLKSFDIAPTNIDNFEELLTLYNINIRTIDKLNFIQESLQNIVFSSNLDTYPIINKACVEYLGGAPDNESSSIRSSITSLSSAISSPRSSISSLSSAISSPSVSSRSSTPYSPSISSRSSTPSFPSVSSRSSTLSFPSVSSRGSTPSFPSVSSRGPSPLPVPPPKIQPPQEVLAQQKVRPPAPLQPASIPPQSKPESSLPSPPPQSRPPSTASTRPTVIAGPARTFYGTGQGPSRAPLLSQSSIIPESSPLVTAPQKPPPPKVTILTTKNTFNITLNGITLEFDKKHNLTLDGINSMLDRFIFENNGITILSPIGSRFNIILYDSIINKDAFNITEITLEGNDTDDRYYHFKPI
jgi:hypothetical protein